MRGKRLDSQGRVLQTGESQRKDGRYVFTYYEGGKKKFIYSWKLIPGDPLPEGSREDASLREKEQRRKKMPWEASFYGKDGESLQVSELIRKYFDQKAGLSYNTISVYQSLLKVVEADEIGSRDIREVRISDAKQWFARMQREGKSYSFIKMMKAILQPAFEMAVEDELIRKNPFDFAVNKFLVNDRKKRDALTTEQEEAFLQFVREDEYYSRYYPAVYILFNTGLRVSEFAGLTISDIDFGAHTLTVNHQLIYVDGAFHIVKPKTESGVRVLPMTDAVEQSFRRILADRRSCKPEPSVDGTDGFLYLAQKGGPLSPSFWKQALPRIWEKYERTRSEELPRITPHICRHTYCTKMARKGIHPKALQYLMGHSNISITLDVYTHLQYEDARDELKRIGVIEE